jgi:hypothetical protein
MRLLFTFAGGSGHLEPLVPIAWAAREAGHVVAFSGRPAAAARVRELRFEMFVTGPPGPEAPAARTPLLAVDRDREDAVLREGFAGRIARERAAGVLEICAERRPDVLVCGEVDFGAVVAAERAGLPFARVLISATEMFVRPEVVAEPTASLRAEHGLAAEPPPEGLVLSPFPRRLRWLPPGAYEFRPHLGHHLQPRVRQPLPSARSQVSEIYRSTSSPPPAPTSIRPSSAPSRRTCASSAVAELERLATLRRT